MDAYIGKIRIPRSAPLAAWVVCVRGFARHDAMPADPHWHFDAA